MKVTQLVLQDAVVKAINQMLGDKSNYQAQLQLNIAAVVRASQATSVENIDEKLMALQQELIQKAQSKEAYDEIADEIFRLFPELLLERPCFLGNSVFHFLYC